MRAVVLREFGPPDVLEACDDAPPPVARDGESAIDVELANITFVETQVRAGRPPHPSMLPQLPAILGNGVGGTAAGARVVASLGGTGGYAEDAVAASDRLIAVPDALAMRDAVALLADGRTAVGLIELARPRPGETVLVEAAAGGVGTLLVQLARNAGARVVALAGGERKLELARELGADLAVDYRDDAWPERVGIVDVVFDGVGGTIGTTAFDRLDPGGRFCPFGMASGSFAEVAADLADARGVAILRGAPPTPDELLARTRTALEYAAAGRLRPVVGQEFALADAAAAHAAIESRATLGKTLLVVR